MTPVAKRLASKSRDDKPGTVVCEGELLLRLSAPPCERLFQGPALRFHVGGAEANVAVGLAHLGHRARMLSAVPASMVGRAAIDALRRYGIDTQGVIQGPGRMGLYFLESAAAGRSGEVVYDRAGSTFAQATLPRACIDAALEGATLLHCSGITSALGAVPRQGLRTLWRAAQAAAIPVSFDCNYRPSLWQGRLAEARRELAAGLAAATIAFADARVLALVMGEAAPRQGDAAFTRLARKAFSRYPGLQQIAATGRVEHSASRHELRGLLATREGLITSGPVVADPIVDRIGTGDAFAAALLLGVLEGLPAQRALDLAVAACVLKHSFQGDFNLATRAEIEALADGKSAGIRR
jgi:2-dehydro-3-deoxygluconokinase